MLQKTNWMLPFLLLIGILVPNILQAQYAKNHKDKFKEQLEKDSKLIGSDYDFTIEKTIDKTYILKYYDPDSKQLLERISYSDKKLTTKEGEAAMYSYQGKLLMEGIYIEDLKEDEWIEYYPNGTLKAKGKYKQGQKTGTWEYFNFNGEMTSEEQWNGGVIVSKQEFAPSDSTSFVFKFRDSILTTPPLFVKCDEDKGEEAAIQCAQIKMLEFLFSNIRYPGIDRNNGIQGTCIVKFIIGRDGTLSNFLIEQSVSPSLDKESLRVVSAMPPWVPAKINGTPVNVWYSFPIRFRLD